MFQVNEQDKPQNILSAITFFIIQDHASCLDFHTPLLSPSIVFFKSPFTYPHFFSSFFDDMAIFKVPGPVVL